MVVFIGQGDGAHVRAVAAGRTKGFINKAGFFLDQNLEITRGAI